MALGNCEKVSTAKGRLNGAVLGDNSGEGHGQVRKSHVCHAQVMRLPAEGDGQPLKGNSAILDLQKCSGCIRRMYQGLLEYLH